VLSRNPPFLFTFLFGQVGYRYWGLAWIGLVLLFAMCASPRHSMRLIRPIFADSFGGKQACLITYEAWPVWRVMCPRHVCPYPASLSALSGHLHDARLGLIDESSYLSFYGQLS
jgi:hypothetical protein